jgi:hypothetical protein
MSTSPSPNACCDWNRPNTSFAEAAQSVRHLNQTELGRRWRVSPRTLERWRWLKQGPAFLKLGGRVAYRIEDIEAFEAVQLHGSAPAGTTGTSSAPAAA